MVDVSELEMRILAELEEARQEDALTLLNTVFDVTGDHAELDEFQIVLRGLLLTNKIRIQMSSIPNGRTRLNMKEALDELDRLSTFFQFSSSEGHWKDSREQGPPYFQEPAPEIVVTDAGYEKCSEVVSTRGYRWWLSDR